MHFNVVIEMKSMLPVRTATLSGAQETPLGNYGTFFRQFVFGPLSTGFCFLSDGSCIHIQVYGNAKPA